MPRQDIILNDMLKELQKQTELLQTITELRDHDNVLKNLTETAAAKAKEEIQAGETQETTPSEDADAKHPSDVLNFIENLIGKSEIDDYDELMDLFKKYGIKTGDIRLDSEAWCGRLMRLALVACGYDDPGPEFDRAKNWEHYGEEEIPAAGDNPFAVPPATILVYWTHVSMKARDNSEVSGNVGNEVKKSPVPPAARAWFGEPIATRRIV